MPTGTRLPLELLRIIFLQVAESSTSSCCTLCAVSSWARHLALPFLYRTVSIDSDHTEHLESFARSVTSGPLTCPPSPTFCPADVVRHLWVGFDSKTLKSIVQRCKNITHLATCTRSLADLADVSPSHPNRQGHPRRTGVHTTMGDLHVVLIQNYTYPSLLAPVGKNSLFTRITHLRLEDPMGLAPFQLVVDMPRLTHLAIPCWYDENLDEIPSRISGTSVKVFVVVLKYLDESECQVFEDWIRESRKENEWIYAVGQQDLLEEEWNAEVRGVTTIWERAAAHTRLLMNRA